MAQVTTAAGDIAGIDSDGIHAFKGIPYGAPISGENRWLPPQPPTPWTDVRDATRFGNICPQEAPPNKWLAGLAGKKFMETLWKDEVHADDCLNLNIWTPTLDAGAKLPVMFWIHGGSFVTGSGSLPIYDGTNLARKDVVVVSINYRLGLMGSFAAPGMFEGDFCGPNRGFEDQLAALRWVQQNISGFGGDPGNVTIFGESAGGQSIAVLVASPASKGLFQRAIAQSGTPEFCGAIADHEPYARDVLGALGIKPGDRVAMSALTGKDTVEAMKVARKLLAAKDAEEKYGQMVVHSNIGCIHGTEFMPVHVLDSLKQGVARDIDLMIGTVREDGRLFPLVMPGPEAFAAWLCMKFFKNLVLPRNQPDLVYERYRQAMPEATNAYVRGQIMTDCVFRRGTVRAAEIHAESAPGRTFLYQFNWSSPVPGIGAMHGIDVPLTNQNLEAFEPILGDIEALRELADTISDAWVNFARTGVPTADMPDWPAFDATRRATMIFDNRIEVQYDVDSHLRKIWYG